MVEDVVQVPFRDPTNSASSVRATSFPYELHGYILGWSGSLEWPFGMGM